MLRRKRAGLMNGFPTSSNERWSAKLCRRSPVHSFSRLCLKLAVMRPVYHAT